MLHEFSSCSVVKLPLAAQEPYHACPRSDRAAQCSPRVAPPPWCAAARPRLRHRGMSASASYACASSSGEGTD
jgi:hypothetical protein